MILGLAASTLALYNLFILSTDIAVILPTLAVWIKEVCLNLFVYLVVPLTRADLQTDDKDLLPKVELVGGVSRLIFFLSLPAWLFWMRQVRTSITTPGHCKKCPIAETADVAEWLDQRFK